MRRKKQHLKNKPHVTQTNQVSPVVLASIFKNTKCFLRLLQLVVNAKHNQTWKID